MICVSLGNIGFSECMEAIAKYDFLELRLDLLQFTAEEFSRLFTHSSKLIAANHAILLDSNMKIILNAAIDASVAYIDINYNLIKKDRDELIAHASAGSTKVILSYHNYSETPQERELLDILELCYIRGANIAKIACIANSQEDSARILSLYNCEVYLLSKMLGKKLISIAMGEKGKFSRLAASFLCAPWIYSSLRKGLETAPAQIDFETMNKIINLLNQ